MEDLGVCDGIFEGIVQAYDGTSMEDVDCFYRGWGVVEDLTKVLGCHREEF